MDANMVKKFKESSQQAMEIFDEVCQSQGGSIANNVWDICGEQSK